MKTVLITGSSSGIGRAAVLRLARSGYRVLAGVRDPADGPGLEAAVVGCPGAVTPVRLDVTDEEGISAALALTKEHVDADGLVAIVNNAGQPVAGPLEVLPLDDLRHELEVNLVGQIAVTQAFLPMLRASRGKVVFITSIGGRIVLPFAGAYHASKFGLEAAAEVLRMELQGSGVQVVSIEPGVTDSEIWQKALVQSGEMLAGLPEPQRRLYEADMGKFRERLRQVRDDENIAADKVAEAIEDAIASRRPPTRDPVGTAAWVAARGRPLIPDRVWGMLARRPFST